MVLEKVIVVLKLIVKPSIALLLLLFIANGYTQVVISSQVTRQITDVKVVGLAMAEFSVVEVLVTIVLGRVADRIGHQRMVLIATIATILGSAFTLVMNEYQSFWVYVPPALFAIADTVYQTECISIIGHYFTHSVEDVFATYRLVQGLGSSLCSYITPVFSGNEAACNMEQLIVEMAVEAVISILAFLLFLCFLAHSNIERMQTEPKPTDKV